MKKLKALNYGLLLMALFYVTFTRCKNPTQTSVGRVRTAVKLSQNAIPGLAGATEVRAAERPRLWEIGDGAEKFYVVNYDYRWKFSSDVYFDVDLKVAETSELAALYLNERRRISSIPEGLLSPEDKPTIAGDISFGGGRDFIRDNIVIEIRATETLKEKIAGIAKQIDALLLTSRTASSADRFKPRIEKFQIAQNPVQRGSTTRLIIEVKDPLGGKLYYDWRFIPSEGNYGGIVTDEFGNYFYYAELEAQIEKLILIAINDGGFCSLADIEIEIVGSVDPGL